MRLLLIISVWSFAGFVFWLFLSTFAPGVESSEECEFVNPKYLYNNIKVNWFGAFFLATLYSLMCPIGTVLYWLYVLCTIGRK